MARLYLFAEGQTEQTFANNLLKPHLANGGVYLHPPVLTAHAKGHRGGVLKYAPVKNDILRFLAQEKTADVFFTTMIDLYRLPNDFPGWKDAEKLRRSPGNRVQALERSFAEDIGDSRFIPYIQLHEFEAYLFSDPTQFGFFYDHHKKEISALQSIADGKSTPELINDGEDTSPSKRIIAKFPAYKKIIEGSQVAELIGLNVIRSKCPHFAMWLSRIEQLGAGSTV